MKTAIVLFITNLIVLAAEMPISSDLSDRAVVKQYIENLYDATKDDTFIIDEIGAIATDVLFYKPMLREGLSCNPFCRVSDFKLTKQDYDNAISAVFNHQKKIKKVSSGEYKIFATIAKKEMQQFLDNSVDIITFDKNSGVLKVYIVDDYGDGYFAITVNNNGSITKVEDSYAVDNIYEKITFTINDTNLTHEGVSYICSMPGCLSGRSIDAIENELDILAGLEPTENIRFTIDKYDGSILDVQGRLYYYFPNYLQEYFYGQWEMMEAMIGNSTLFANGDWIDISNSNFDF